VVYDNCISASYQIQQTDLGSTIMNDINYKIKTSISQILPTLQIFDTN